MDKEIKDIMKLYLVRHGETQWNKEHILQGQLDSPLTEKGTGGAVKIRESLKDIEFTRVYTSHQKRAMATADIILEGRTDTTYIVEPDIAEMSYGEWQGKTMEEICSTPESEQDYLNYFKKPENFVPVEGGEGFDDVIKRAELFIDRLRNEHEDDDVILAVSHGVFIKALFVMIRNLEISKFWEKPFITNCSISIFDLKKDEIEIISEVDTSHLGEHQVSTAETDYIKKKV